MDLDNKYGTLEIQKALLVLLKEFDDFCNENGIEYSLSSGSLLGAVRHKGFIPWDDDLDCIMSRENMNKFRKAITDHDTLRLESCTEATLWTERLRFKKTDYDGLYQPTLDVFILDNCPDNKLKAKIKLLTIQMLQGMIKYHLSVGHGSILMRALAFVTYFIGLPFSHRTKYRWYNKVAQWGNNTPSRYKSIYHDQWKALKYRYPFEIMNKTMRIPFEELEVNGFVEYDKYLRIIYGDNYMTPPSETDRTPYHM